MRTIPITETPTWTVLRRSDTFQALTLLAFALCLAVFAADAPIDEAAVFLARGKAALDAGEILNALDDFDSALGEIEKAADRSSVTAHEIHFQRSRAFGEQGHHASAQHALDAAIAEAPNRPGYYFERAKLACLTGNADRAALDLCKGCELGGTPDSDLLLDVQLELSKAGDYERETLEMDTAPISLPPLFQEEMPLVEALARGDTQANRDKLARVRHVRALDLMEYATETGREREAVLAISYARSATELSGQPRDFFLLGSLHMLRDDVRSDLLAEKAFTAAAKDSELGPAADLARGQLLLKRGQYTGAAKALARAVEVNPDLLAVDVVEAIVTAHTIANMAPAGITLFARMEREAPTAPECRLARAILTWHEGRGDEAKTLVDGLGRVKGCRKAHLNHGRALLEAWREETPR